MGHPRGLRCASSQADVTLSSSPERPIELEKWSEAHASYLAVARVHAAQIVNSFDPDKALATSMDIQSRESMNKIYTPETVKVCLSAGWGPISYRLHTPETVDYWHWNPNGRWSDEVNQRGYFVGSSELGEPIRDSFG